jgi:hypothetical protein
LFRSLSEKRWPFAFNDDIALAMRCIRESGVAREGGAFKASCRGKNFTYFRTAAQCFYFSCLKQILQRHFTRGKSHYLIDKDWKMASWSWKQAYGGKVLFGSKRPTADFLGTVRTAIALGTIDYRVSFPAGEPPMSVPCSGIALNAAL